MQIQCCIIRRTVYQFYSPTFLSIKSHVRDQPVASVELFHITIQLRHYESETCAKQEPAHILNILHNNNKDSLWFFFSLVSDAVNKRQ